MTRSPSSKVLSDDLLQRYHDGDLSSAERAEVESLLDADARLRLEALDELGGLLRAHAASEPQTVDFSSTFAAIERSTQAASAPVRPKRRALLPLSALGAFVAGAFALFMFLRPGVGPSNEAQLESLEVSGSSATVLRMPDEKTGQTTTIIWASLDEEPTDEPAGGEL